MNDYPDYPDDTGYDYYAAGKRSSNQTCDQAELNFESLARQYGVKAGPYGSWDQFWMGYGYD